MEDIINAHAKFATDLYKSYEQVEENILFSPIGIHNLLAAVYTGAADETKTALETVTYLESQEKTIESYEKIITEISSISDVKLSMNNGIFLSSDLPLKNEFKNTIAEKLRTEIQSINLADTSSAADSINSWIKQKIKTVPKCPIQADSLSPNDKLILINCFSLALQWETKFDPAGVLPFHVSKDQEVEVPYMTFTNEIFFKDDDQLNAQIIDLPFQDNMNNNMSMLIVHPYERRMTNLETRLAKNDLSLINEDMKFRYTSVTIPKFKIDTLVELKSPLEKVGLADLFDESKAKLSNLTDKSLAVSKVFQQVIIDVGSEGASSSPKKKDARGNPQKPQEKVIINSPFILLIKVNDSNPYFLFKAKITNPKTS